jgi:hypothetical protein
MLMSYDDLFEDDEDEDILEMTDEQEFVQDSMALGDINDRVRIIFYDPWRECFVGVTPDHLVEHGVPYNADADGYCTYNSTHLAT